MGQPLLLASCTNISMERLPGHGRVTEHNFYNAPTATIWIICTRSSVCCPCRIALQNATQRWASVKEKGASVPPATSCIVLKPKPSPTIPELTREPVPEDWNRNTCTTRKKTKEAFKNIQVKPMDHGSTHFKSLPVLWNRDSGGRGGYNGTCSVSTFPWSNVIFAGGG